MRASISGRTTGQRHFHRIRFPCARSVVSACVMVVVAARCGSAAHARSEPPSPGLEERERVRLVLMATTVADKKGRPVLGLEADDFRVSEEGQPRAIEFFGTEGDRPVSVAFLLDLSGSMALHGRLEQAKRWIQHFVGQFEPRDRAGLIGFADDQVAWITRLTADRKRFLLRLSVQEGLGPTALYDALAAAPGLIEESVRDRKAIVLVTDGLDNASTVTTLEATWIARRASLPIYVLNFVHQRPDRLRKTGRRSVRILRRFSEETGGRGFAVHSEDDLREAVEAILRELRFQYVIGYYPDDVSDGTFRRVRIETVRDGLRIRTRSGYYAVP